MKVSKYIQLTMIFHQENDGRWVGICQELGTSDYGGTLLEAQERLNEAVQLHLNTLETLGECEDFLKDNDVKVYTSKTHKMEVNLKNINSDVFIKPQLHQLEHAC